MSLKKKKEKDSYSRVIESQINIMLTAWTVTAVITERIIN